MFQPSRLAMHSFRRTVHDPEALGLLVGNAELGGVADVSGLGIACLWAADLWRDTHERVPVDGPSVTCQEFGAGRKPQEYLQELALADGVLRTRVTYAPGEGYEAELFCSMANPHLIALRVTNLGGAGRRSWCVRTPGGSSLVRKCASGAVMGGTNEPAFTRAAWAFRADKTLTSAHDGTMTVSLAPGETVTLATSWTTHWDGEDYLQKCESTVDGGLDFDAQTKSHRAAWATLWRQAAAVTLPDPALEQLWYRSLFWTLCTCGTSHFLPGECMFAVHCWQMRPFTYGAAGWAVQAFTALGLPHLARTMLEWHFKPEALRQNAAFYTQHLAGKASAPDAWAFAHEVDTDGRNNPCGHYDFQRHLDGFAAALFYRLHRFYPDAAFNHERVYPVLRGTSEFWRGLSRWDDAAGGFVLPSMSSLSEDLEALHPLDAALAAKWCWLQAARTASELGRDPELRSIWKDLSDRICIPQNDIRYLEYLGDPDLRPGGGYMGVRGPVYLTYPTLELIPVTDPAKVARTLDHTWERNSQGAGMIGFVATWFALADVHCGRGEHALAMMRHSLKCLDPWGTSVTEFPGSRLYYFTTIAASYLTIPLSMAVQSCDDRISVFPAVPAEWGDFAFENVPAEAGVRVSGQMKGGQVMWAAFHIEEEEILRLDRKATVAIRREKGKIQLRIIE